MRCKLIKELLKKWFYWDIFDDSEIVKPIHKVKEIVPQVEEIVLTEHPVKEVPKEIVEEKKEEVIEKKKKPKIEKKVSKKQEKKIDKKKTKKKKK